MLSPDYIVGFVDGEGCFCITLNRKRNETPEVRLIFEIEVRFDDELILEKIKHALGCGNIYRLEYQRQEKWHPHVKLKVNNFTDINQKVIPFFKQHRLQAKKYVQFDSFCPSSRNNRAKAAFEARRYRQD
jgi:adenylate kinase family enzyme